ncbi:hypothetical protein C8R44DRAFT_741277 [Mycena epipterygia]|nr:hypothetical protein C8R44DRAFT_741277 [Mycena epipterygia]
MVVPLRNVWLLYLHTSAQCMLQPSTTRTIRQKYREIFSRNEIKTSWTYFAPCYHFPGGHQVTQKVVSGQQHKHSIQRIIAIKSVGKEAGLQFCEGSNSKAETTQALFPRNAQSVSCRVSQSFHAERVIRHNLNQFYYSTVELSSDHSGLIHDFSLRRAQRGDGCNSLNSVSRYPARRIRQCCNQHLGVNTYRAVKYSDMSGGDWIVLPGAGGGLEHLGACRVIYYSRTDLAWI